jgi:hypothetical protein
MHSHCERNDPMIGLRIIRMCAISFYPQVNDCIECFHWIAVKMNTFIDQMLKIPSFELIYRRSLAYVCEMQYVQASIRHVSSSDENYTWRKSIKSDTQHESLCSINKTNNRLCLMFYYNRLSISCFRFRNSLIFLSNLLTPIYSMIVFMDFSTLRYARNIHRKPFDSIISFCSSISCRWCWALFFSFLFSDSHTYFQLSFYC